MKSNDDFSLDKENIVGKTVRKERKCFAAGCISALCLLFTIPAPFLSTWTDRLSARQHRKLLLRAMPCYVFLFFRSWQNYKIGRRFIARQPHKVTSRWSTIARQTSKASPQGAAMLCYVSLFLASWQKDHNLQQVINITSFSSATSGFVCIICLNVLLLGLRRSWEIWKQCFVLVVLHTAPDM